MNYLQTILNGCRENNASSQRQLYNRYYRYMFRIAYRYIYNRDKVPDIVNDGFVKFFKNIRLFKSENPDLEPGLKGWLKKIVVNTAIDELRKNKFAPIIVQLSVDNGAQADAGTEPDASTLYKELLESIKELPPSLAAVFNMSVIDGFSHREISEALNITVGTSKSNLFKAKAILRKAMNREVGVPIN